MTTHVRLGNDTAPIFAARIAEGRARLVLGGDVIVTSGADVLSRILPGGATAIVNSHRQPTSAHALDPDMPFPAAEGEGLLMETFGTDGLLLRDATQIAERLFGDGIYANMLLLGMAWQRGTIPLAAASLESAIELNGIAVANNLAAFRWGRQLVADELSVLQAADLAGHDPAPETLEDLIAYREGFLTDYQDQNLATRYRQLVDKAATAEKLAIGKAGEFTEAVTRGYFKLLAYKDEYEVARLLSHPDFLLGLKDQFDGTAKISFHLAPPVLAHPGNASGKRNFGAWIIPALRLLAKFKSLRGTTLDPFGYLQERRDERALIREYETNIATLIDGLSAENIETATAIANLPMDIRGYGHVKQQAMQLAADKLAALLAEHNSGTRKAA